MLPPSTAVDASPRHSGSTFLVHAALGLCLVLAALSGPVVWFFLTQFIWTSDDPVDPDIISPERYSLADGLWAAVLVPTSWPLAFLLLGLLVRSVLRATSNRAPRPPRDR